MTSCEYYKQTKNGCRLFDDICCVISQNFSFWVLQSQNNEREKRKKHIEESETKEKS